MTGHAEGKNVGVEYRWAEFQMERLSAVADNLFRREVAVIAAIGGTLVAKAATTTIHLSIINSYGRISMPVASLPELGAPPTPAPLLKIALEEHFGYPIVFMRDSDGRFETRKEANIGHLGPEYFEVVQERLLDFNTTRLQAMDEAGVDKALLSFGAGFRTFGVQGILNRVEARHTARIVNDFLAEQVRA